MPENDQLCFETIDPGRIVTDSNDQTIGLIVQEEKITTLFTPTFSMFYRYPESRRPFPGRADFWVLGSGQKYSHHSHLVQQT
jgi:hypothetical protein